MAEELETLKTAFQSAITGLSNDISELKNERIRLVDKDIGDLKNEKSQMSNDLSELKKDRERMNNELLDLRNIQAKFSKEKKWNLILKICLVVLIGFLAHVYFNQSSTKISTDPSYALLNLKIETNSKFERYEKQINEIEDNVSDLKRGLDSKLVKMKEEIKSWALEESKEKKLQLEVEWSPGPNYAVEGSSIIKTGHDGWNTNVISKWPLGGTDSVVFYVKLEKTKASDVMIGVAPASFDQSREYNYGEGGEGFYYYCASGNKFSKSAAREYTGGRKIHEGEVVGVVVDFKLSTISFIVDGKNLGPAFTFEPETKLFPVILIYHERDEVKLLGAEVTK